MLGRGHPLDPLPCKLYAALATLLPMQGRAVLMYPVAELIYMWSDGVPHRRRVPAWQPDPATCQRCSARIEHDVQSFADVCFLCA